MVNRTITIILFVTLAIFGFYVWYYTQQLESGNIEQPQQLNIQQQPTQNQNWQQALQQFRETRNITRQIEQVKAERDPPEVQHLQSLINDFEKDPTRWDIILAIGDIYRKGAYPRFLPNEEIAVRCFKIASMCPDGKVAGMGQSKYIETHDDPIKNADKAGTAMPIEFGLKACELAESAIQSTPWHLFEKPQMLKPHVQQPQFEPLPFVDAHDDFMLDFLGTTNVANADDTHIQYRSDSQNVHDHAVTKITKHNIDKLASNIDITKLATVEDIKNAILTNEALDVATKDDALYVIDKLGEAKHSNFNVSEQEALSVVWNKIQQMSQQSTDANLKKNLTETLAKQLASSIEHGNVVCSSGKITRILGTLDGVSNEPSRPTWVLREELSAMATRLRDQYTKELGDTPMAGQRMREEFNKQVKEEYINKLGMSPKIIEPLIIEYELGF